MSWLLHAAALHGSCALWHRSAIHRHLPTHVESLHEAANTSQPLKACHLLQAWRRAYKQYTKGVISAETLAEVTASCKVRRDHTFTFMTSQEASKDWVSCLKPQPPRHLPLMKSWF